MADITGCLGPHVLGPVPVEAFLKLRQRLLLLLVLQAGAGQHIGLLHYPRGAQNVEECHTSVLLYDHDVDCVLRVTLLLVLLAALLALGHVKVVQRLKELSRVLNAGCRVPALVHVSDGLDVELPAVLGRRGGGLVGDGRNGSSALFGWVEGFTWVGRGKGIACVEDLGLRLVVLLLALSIGLLVLAKLVLPVVRVLSL
ncbi:hypothetical protein PG996_010516 [Apiospora saccharicola]|uniref:Uncharacterized protein n=1 Tax=Apiospora saccharicola TaxID=335842 RepID=A0ABR1UNU0_9PEZI